MTRGTFTQLFWDIGVVLIAYYGLRLAGADDYVALLAATALAGVRLVYVAARDRRVDLFAGFLFAIFGVGLVLALVTHDPASVLMTKSATTGVAGVLFLGSIAARKPLTFAALRRVSTPDALAAYDRLWTESAAFRTRNYRLTALWGCGLLFDAIVRIPVALLLPLDVATGLSSAIEIGVIVVLVLITRHVVARAKAAEGDALAAVA